jgi:PAS domain S-box-containing protein
MPRPASDTAVNAKPKTLLPWLILAISLACALLAWYWLRQAIAEKARAQFDATVQRSVDEIAHRLRAHQQVLRGGAGLFGASREVARGEWRDYVASLKIDQYFPAMQAIGYAEVLSPQDLQAHLTQVRAEGFPEYAIHPDGARELYTPVRYIEPFAGANLRAFGYDMFAEGVRSAAMQQARDSGEPVMSGKVTLVQETGQTKRQANVLLYLAVYRQEIPGATLDARRRALRGYVYAAFRMNDLMTSVLGRNFADIDVEIFDGSTATPEALLFDGDGILHAFAQGYATPFRSSRQIAVAGREWLVQFSARPNYLSGAYGITPAAALLGGSTIGALLFALSWVQANTHVRAQRLAETMSAALRASEARLDGIIRGAMEAIITTDDKQTIVMFNPAAESMFGCSAKEALGAPLERFIPARFHSAHRRHVEAFARTGASTRTMGAQLDLYAVRANGAEFPIDASISKTEHDGQQFFTVLLRDITRRKQADQAIAQANQFNQEIMANVNEGIIVYDRELRVRTCNPFMEELTGLKREQMLGKPMYEIFPGLREYPVQHSLQRALAGESVVASEPIGRYRGSAQFLPAGSHQQAFDDPRIAWTLTTWAPHRNERHEITGVIVTVVDMTQLKRSQDMLQRSNAKLRELSAHLESAREAERTRIAREIHDELAGTLTGIKMDLSAASELSKDIPGLQQKVLKLTHLVDNAVQTTRRIINDLRPSILDNLGVWAAIEWLAQDVAGRANLQCEVIHDESVAQLELPAAKSTALFRIVQESLTNVWRHAGATRVTVRSYRDGDHVIVEIVDDGKGLTETDLAKAGHWGVMGMHERAKAQGGEVSLTGTIGRGTAVRVQMPMRD